MAAPVVAASCFAAHVERLAFKAHALLGQGPFVAVVNTLRETPWAASRTSDALPAWPFTWVFALFPLWWFLGLADVAIILAAVPMLLYLILWPGLRAPKGTGWWLAFLAFMFASVVELTRGTEILTFGYRAAIYVSSTIVLLYVFNARSSLTERRVLRHLTIYWVTVLVGGVLGLLVPTGHVKTPMYYVVEHAVPSLLHNNLVQYMVVRQFAQYSPNGYNHIAPRPSAPFLYTNNWGNVYSILLPLMLVMLARLPKGSRARLVLLIALPLSAVPALLTLNRGMVLGLVIAAVYATVRLALRGDYRALQAMILLGIIGAVLWAVLPIQQRLDTRVHASTTTRGSLYAQSLDVVKRSPLLGYGVPVHSTNTLEPPVGTQGQIWMLLVSHGYPATICFMMFFVVMAWRSQRRADMLGIICSSVLVAGTVELLYYGVVPYGLPLMMTVVAVAVRPRSASLTLSEAPARSPG